MGIQHGFLDELRWLAEHGPCSWANKHSPSPRQRRQLIKLGLVEEVPTLIGIIYFRVTDAGREFVNQMDEMLNQPGQK